MGEVFKLIEEVESKNPVREESRDLVILVWSGGNEVEESLWAEMMALLISAERRDVYV